MKGIGGMLRVGAYNVEWFDDLFDSSNQLKTGGEEVERLDAIAAVITSIDCDALAVTEAPNTTANRNQTTIKKLTNFAAHYQLRLTKVRTGLLSSGRQEQAVMFDPSRLRVEHRPGGRKNSATNPRFDEEFRVDSDADRIKEIYEHYRPPLETVVTDNTTGKTFRLMVVHAKSKGIFSSVDQTHLELESQRNRRKLYAESTSIRQRVEQWLADGESVIACGDINDGPGIDWYEKPFGRSAVEIILGDIFEPKSLLVSHTGRRKTPAD